MSSVIKSRVVIKIGSKLVTSEDVILDIVENIVSFNNMENEVVIVSSGAIATGLLKLDIEKKSLDLPSKQAAASIGQVGIMNKWAQAFSKYDKSCAQILLTKSDFEDKNKYFNVRNTILKLLSWGVIPIINENDTVATEEIKFGDNDTLSAIVATKIDANYLIILTDVDGLYKGNPQKNKDAELVLEVAHSAFLSTRRQEVTISDVEKYATSDGGYEFSVGGMLSKIEAAKIATSSGVETYIANGKKNICISDIISGNVRCTKFIADNRIDEII
ncbi:MAG: glutamate 5-kinase [Elusimicrobiota bacterium]